MTTTTEQQELRDLADIALKIGRADLEKTKQITPIIVFRRADNTVHHLRFPAYAAGLMNNGNAKDAIFGFIRRKVQEEGLTAVIFATEAWFGPPTALGLAQLAEIGYEAYRERHRYKNVEALAAEGLCEQIEVIMVTAQTAEYVLYLKQAFRRDEETGKVISYSEPDCEFDSQETFFGRQKMYGDCREENIR